MASVLKVDKLDPQSGTALELGTSGDTVSLPSGATLDISASTLTPPATMPASSGVNFTALNATNLGSGTVPDARVPATMPASSGVNLTALNATNLGSGTVPDARFPATLPAASGVNLTSLDAANLGSNTVPTARLGSGTASSSTILYGDQTFKTAPTSSVFGTEAFATRADTKLAFSWSTEVLVPCNQEIIDDGGNYDNTAGNYKYTSPETGVYFFYYSLKVDKTTGMGQCVVAPKRNTTSDIAYYSSGALNFKSLTVDSTQIANCNTSSNVSGSFCYDLTAGDYIQLYMYFYHWGTQDDATMSLYGTRFGGWRVS